jgi:hypothetical protein
MKNIKFPNLFFCLVLSIFAWGCSEEEITPSVEELRNKAYDLVVVSDASSSIPVTFGATGNLEKITVTVTPQGKETIVAQNSLSNITADNLNRVTLNVPFPGNNVAPSGMYTVSYTLTTGAGKQTAGTYDINVINNMAPVLCNYTQVLPTGKNVWIRLYVPEGKSLPASDNIYLTGSFGSREGGSDWDGGGANSPFVFKKLSSTCYELAMHLESGDLLKITRGSWDKEMAGATGNIPGNFTYNGEKAINFTAFNWKDLQTVTPSVPQNEILNIPSAAVKPGMLTVVADVASNIDVKSGIYYVVQKGATNLTNAYKMTPFEEANKLAAAVPKDANVEYVIVKDAAQATGKNRYGFVQSVRFDGKTNPVRITVGTFGNASFTLGNKIVIVGGATPGDWGVSSGQDFTKTAEGKYEITIALKADSEYLLLPNYNQWDDKWAFGTGTPLAGTFSNQGNGSNFSTKGLAAGNYKIEVDFTKGNGSYKLTKL